jgi:hypothetical protein
MPPWILVGFALSSLDPNIVQLATMGPYRTECDCIEASYDLSWKMETRCMPVEELQGFVAGIYEEYSR